MKYEDLYTGMHCTVNRWGDIAFDVEVRPFLDSDCILIKVTKSGLIQVALSTDMRKTYSVPLKNISMVNYENS